MHCTVTLGVVTNSTVGCLGETERLSLHIFFDEAVYIKVCCKFERIQRLQNRLLDNVKIYGDRPFLTHFVTMLQSCWAPQATLPLRC